MRYGSFVRWCGVVLGEEERVRGVYIFGYKEGRSPWFIFLRISVRQFDTLTVKAV